MSESKENEDLISKIEEWLEKPQFHLNDQSRRKLLEIIISDHVERVRRAERNRVRGKDFLLVASVLTVLGSFGPKMLIALGVMDP